MTFLNLTFLWALPLLAVPIAIHLLSRRRQEVVKWGAMQFLMTGSIRRRRIWRIDDLLLMLLRILAVIALILALARPLWHGTGPTGGAHREVIFVWDVSLSMGQKWGNRTAYDAMLEKTDVLMHQLGSSDRIRGLVTAGPGEWLTTESVPGDSENKKRLINRLREFGLTETDTDWRRIIEMALHTPVTAGVAARLVVVVTDGQSEGWSHEDETSWKELLDTEQLNSVATAVEVYQISGESQENLSVAGLMTPRQLLGRGETFSVEARIQNLGLHPSSPATIEWTLDNQSLGQTTVPSLAAGQSSRTTVKASTETAGVRQITCALRYDDVLSADNSRSLLVETIDHVPFLMVDDDTETDTLRTDRGYLLAAMGQSSDDHAVETASKPEDVRRTTSAAMGLFHVEIVPSSSLESATLENYRAILMPSVPELSESAVAEVSKFVRQGGALWLSLGDRTNPEEFNRRFHRGGSGLSPWAVRAAKGDLVEREQFDTIHPPDKEHPATMLLSDTQRLDIDRAKIFRHFTFSTAQAGSRVPVLLKSGTGEALAIEGQSGRGRVIVMALPTGVRWSTLPLTQAWVPLVHEWLWYLLQPTAEPLNLPPGETLIVHLPANTGTSHVTVRAPSGITIPTTVIPQGSRPVARTHRTFLPGFYEASVLTEGRPETHRRYQVLRPEEESQLAPWTSAAVTMFSSLKNVRINPASPMQMPVTSSGIRAGQPMSSWLLLVVIVAILTELYLARRIAMKRFGFLNFDSQPGDAAENRSSANPRMTPEYRGSLPNEL